MEELDPRKDEERRAILREVEVRVMQYQNTMRGHYIIVYNLPYQVRVMQYQDELESGRKTVKAGWTVAEQVKIFTSRLSNKILCGTM